MVTIISLRRLNLIMKEEMENYCRGENTFRPDSVNDDLETFFEDLQLGKEPNKNVITYFIQNLTETEMELVELKEPSYLKTFLYSSNADVKEAKMKLSKSNSKFVLGWGARGTFTMENPTALPPFPTLSNCSSTFFNLID